MEINFTPGCQIGDVNTLQNFAVECPHTNTGDAARYRDAGQAVTVGERIIGNSGDAIGDYDVGQTVAVVERIIANAGNRETVVGSGNDQFTGGGLVATGNDVTIAGFVRIEG